MAEPALSGRTSPDRDDHRGRQETIPRQEDSEERLPYPAGQCPVFDVDRRSGKPSPHQHSVLLLFAGPELLLPLRPRFAALQEPRAESIDGYDGHELVADVGWQRPRDPAVRGVPSSPRAGRERGGAAVRFSLSRVRDVASENRPRGSARRRPLAIVCVLPVRPDPDQDPRRGGIRRCGIRNRRRDATTSERANACRDRDVARHRGTPPSGTRSWKGRGRMIFAIAASWPEAIK